MENSGTNTVDKKIESRWFMIHTYSGYEKKVKTDLEQKIEAMGMTEIVKKVLVPEEEIKELKPSRKKDEPPKMKVSFRKLFPGYVMLEMLATREETATGINYKVDSDVWYVVRNTNGVTGFVGVGSDPIPMEDSEVKNIFKAIGYKDDSKVNYATAHKPREIMEVDFTVGDFVKVLDGGFEGHQGKVSAIDLEHGKAELMVEIFGRMTPVEVEFGSLKKV